MTAPLAILGRGGRSSDLAAFQLANINADFAMHFETWPVLMCDHLGRL